MFSQRFLKQLTTTMARRTFTIPVLMALVFAGPLLQSASAEEPNQLIVQFGTGGDDLRGGNDNVHLLLLLHTGAPIRFENVNGLNRWTGSSRQTVSRSLPATLGFHDIVGVRLETTFGGGIAGDNWNLDHLQVRARLGGHTRLLFDQSGSPLFRFTGEQRVREFHFALALDNDGLLDRWEVEQRSLGLSPSKANLIVVPVIRPNMTRAQVQPTLNRVVEFFARVPNRNPDGSTGIGVVIQWGNSLPDIDSDAPGRTPPDYPEVRARGIPAAMIGKGHGVLIGTGTGGGGQTSNSDWSSASNNWHTILHELGHQLGLDHEPRGTGIPSPLYASIMNYDYNYQFNGDSNAVQFSTGKFAFWSLDELNLNEALPFAQADLEFLSRAPYNFRLSAPRPTWTNVDFNRNGTFGERALRVDVNGGSGLTARDRVDFKETAGGFALTTFRGNLVAVSSDLRPPAGWSAYAQAGLSVGNPGRLQYQFYGGERLELPIAGPTGVTGDPHAIEAFGKLFVAYPTEQGYILLAYKPGRMAARLEFSGVVWEDRTPSSHPILVRTSNELYLFAWDGTTKRVRYRKVNATATSATISFGPVTDLMTGRGGRATPVLSESPVGGTWDSKIGTVVLVTTEPTERFQGQMKMIQLGRTGTVWYGQSARWVPAATLSRPTVLFDDRPSAGLSGQYLIYSQWERSGSDTALTELIRMTPGASETWTVQLMQNVWTSTRSAPSATFYRDDIAWGWRVNESFPEVPNILQVFLRASGITDRYLTDFNDVHWIATQGLRESLQAVPR